MTKTIVSEIDGAEDLKVVGDEIFFTSTEGTTMRELWKYDINTGVTLLVYDVNPTSSSNPVWITEVGTDVYFVADDGTNGQELWKYDGNTTILIDVNPGVSSASPSWLTTLGNDLYFEALTPSDGSELCKYDGNTLTIIDINVGASSSPSYLTRYNNAVYFNADDGNTGNELWKTGDMVNIETLSSENDIHIYPNPFTTKFEIIDNQSYQFTLYNSLGKDVTDLISSVILEKSIEVDTKKLISGVYILRIKGKSYRIIKY